MAHTDNTEVDSVVDRVNITFPIVKMEENEDGDLIVYGKATDASIDSDDQIVDADWSAKALEEWLKSGGNVRVQHSPYLYPAGKGLEVHTSENGHYVKALVVEPTAKNLVKKGVLQAYSVGIGRPKIVRDVAAKGGRIVDGKLIEISLVDRPANANCGFTIAKSANGAVVDAEEVFGDIAAALAAVESKIDNAVEEVKEVDTSYASSTKTELLASNIALTPEELNKYLDDRSKFLDGMPDDTKSSAWSVWKSEKEKFFDGTAEARQRWSNKQKGIDVVTETPETEVEKGQKDCGNCGKTYDADAKNRKCEKCGNNLPNASDKADDAEVEKGIADALGDNDEGKGVAATDSLPNRAGEGLQEGKNPGDAPHREDVSKGELPYTLKRLHDVTCGVYSDDVLRDEYATLKSWGDAVNVDAVREAFGDELATVAESVKSSDADLLADARAGLHKGFAQDYPNTHVAPSDMEPGKFRRGFLSSGHYRQNAAGKDSGARIPDGNRTINADQFERGYLGDGHIRQSPAAGGDNASKGAKEVASAAFTRNQLESIHDHIHERRPDVCAWSKSTAVNTRGDAVLTPVTNVNIPSFPSKSADVELIKALVDDAFAPAKAYYEEEIATLKAQVAELGAQPDPALAPVRGVVAKAAGAGKAAPVEKASSVEAIESSYEDRLRAYALKTKGSGDPLIRKQSEEVLSKLSKTAD